MDWLSFVAGMTAGVALTIVSLFLLVAGFSWFLQRLAVRAAEFNRKLTADEDTGQPDADINQMPY